MLQNESSKLILDHVLVELFMNLWKMLFDNKILTHLTSYGNADLRKQTKLIKIWMDIRY